MTREELDRLRKYAEVKDLDKPPLADQAIIELLDTIDALTRERDKLAIEAKAGRECYYALTDFYAMVEGENPSLLEDDCNAIRAWSAIKAYDTSTKGSTHE